MSDPQRHHYVPKFILKPWLQERKPDQWTLRGYYWDEHSNKVRYRDRGVNAFCFGIDLLSLHGQRKNRAILETRYFQHIDTKGSEARSLMLEHGPEALTGEQRCNFARLLLSLEARRPTNVQRLRTDVSEFFRTSLNDDPEIVAAMAAEGVVGSPSAFAEQHFGVPLEDQAMLIIQRLVDNPRVGDVLVNAHWQLKRIKPDHGSLMLSDRPLVRTQGFDRDGTVWLLPLGPHVAFAAANHRENARAIKKASPATFVYRSNISIAGQAEKYVFSTDDRHSIKLRRYLTPHPRAASAPRALL